MYLRLIAALSLVTTCVARGDSTRATINWNGAFERNISAYNLFVDPVSQIPNAGLYAYDINTPLFSDYSVKDRFVYLPDGARMTYREDEPFDVPVSGAIVKTFSYPLDFRDLSKGRRLVETRLLVHSAEGWTGAAYVWNEAQNDAQLKVAGTVVPVEWIDERGAARRTDYLVPNMNHCKHCHRAEGVVQPLGLRAGQLNRASPKPPYAPNQLSHWTALGILDGAPAPEKAPRIAVWDDAASGTIEQRALSYLDVNCAHCHNPKGLAGPTLLDFRLDEALVHRPGVFHRPTAAGNASRGRNFAIVPGNPDASFLLSRLRSTNSDIRMPEIGRTVVHDEGVALIREWILSLAPHTK